MAKAFIGARVIFCGHNAWFIADIHEVGDVNVVRANGNIYKNLIRDDLDKATHHVVDFPNKGFWSATDIGVLVVPKEQVRELHGDK